MLKSEVEYKKEFETLSNDFGTEFNIETNRKKTKLGLRGESYRIIIPRKFIDILGWKKGCFLSYDMKDEEIIIRKERNKTERSLCYYNDCFSCVIPKKIINLLLWKKGDTLIIEKRNKTIIISSKKENDFNTNEFYTTGLIQNLKLFREIIDRLKKNYQNFSVPELKIDAKQREIPIIENYEKKNKTELILAIIKDEFASVID